jgi:uncharacterized protein (DUF1778 family)
MGEKTEILQVRVTGSEKASFERAAEISGLSISSWVRERLRKNSRIELQSSGLKVPFMADISIDEVIK